MLCVQRKKNIENIKWSRRLIHIILHALIVENYGNWNGNSHPGLFHFIFNLVCIIFFVVVFSSGCVYRDNSFYVLFLSRLFKRNVSYEFRVRSSLCAKFDKSGPLNKSCQKNE